MPVLAPMTKLPPPATATATAPSPQDVAQLVRRASDGDVGAFERLVAQHQHRLYSFALSFTGGDRDAASDLVQEALIKVYRSIGSFRFESSFSTWLFRIVKNVFLDVVKSRGARDRELETPIDDELAHLRDAALTDDRLLRADTRRSLERALERVPVAYRMVVVLSDMQELSYDEIARVLDIPVGTVKSRLKRGRDALREEIFRSGELL